MFPLGWAGINTFLLITAFFITKKYMDKPITEVFVVKALKKRAIRLLPPYLAVIMAMTALFIVMYRQLPGDFFSYFLFAQTFQWEFVPETTQVPGVGHFWYLTLDFYLVMIWLFILRFLPRRFIKSAFLLLLCFAVVYRSACTIYTNSITMSYTLPWGMIDAFAAGGLLAYISKTKKTVLPWTVLILGVIGFIACIYITSVRFDVDIINALVYYSTAQGYADSPITVQIHLVMVLLSFFVVWLCVIERKHYNLLSNPRISKWGKHSYELYVFHYPIIWLLQIITNNNFIIIFVGIIATFTITIIWKRFVEPKVSLAFL